MSHSLLLYCLDKENMGNYYKEIYDDFNDFLTCFQKRYIELFSKYKEDEKWFDSINIIDRMSDKISLSIFSFLSSYFSDFSFMETVDENDNRKAFWYSPFIIDENCIEMVSLFLDKYDFDNAKSINTTKEKLIDWLKKNINKEVYVFIS